MRGLHENFSFTWRRSTIVWASAALLLYTAFRVPDAVNSPLGRRVLRAVILRIELQQSVDVGALAIIHKAVAAAKFFSRYEASAFPRSVIHAGLASFVAEAGAGWTPSR